MGTLKTAEAKADLGFLLAHILPRWFCRVPAQIKFSVLRSLVILQKHVVLYLKRCDLLKAMLLNN